MKQPELFSQASNTISSLTNQREYKLKQWHVPTSLGLALSQPGPVHSQGEGDCASVAGDVQAGSRCSYSSLQFHVLYRYYHIELAFLLTEFIQS
jgi:hypothetical protein